MFKDWNKIKGLENCLQDVIDPKTGGVTGQVATLSCIPAVFFNLLTALLMFVGTFALFLFIISGYKYLFSGGDPKKLEGARHSLIYAILGLFIVLLSFFIINIISYVTGVECIKSFGFGCK